MWNINPLKNMHYTVYIYRTVESHYSKPLNYNPSLIQPLLLAPSVAGIARFHCIIIHTCLLLTVLFTNLYPLLTKWMYHYYKYHHQNHQTVLFVVQTIYNTHVSHMTCAHNSIICCTNYIQYTHESHDMCVQYTWYLIGEVWKGQIISRARTTIYHS